jgi:hypothetical protein
MGAFKRIDVEQQQGTEVFGVSLDTFRFMTAPQPLKAPEAVSATAQSETSSVEEDSGQKAFYWL